MCDKAENENNHSEQSVAAHPHHGATASLARQISASQSFPVTRGQPCDPHVLSHSETSSNRSQNTDQHMISEDDRRNFVEEYREMFFMTSLFGVHVIKRIGNGSYSLSLPRLCAGVVMLCLMTMCLVMPMVTLYYVKPNYDLRITLLCILLTGITSSFIFIVWLMDSPKIMAFLAEVDSHTNIVRKPKWVTLVMVTVSLLPLIYTVIFLFMTPPADGIFYAYNVKVFFFIPLYLSSVIPCLMDIYIMSCVHVVVTELKELERRVRGAAVWTPRFTNVIGSHWLRISKLLGTFNEAFSFVLHFRMLLFLVEMITLSFSLVSLQWRGQCLIYFAVLAGKNLGMVCHFLAVCVSGERLMTAQEAVAGAVREVHAKPNAVQLVGENKSRAGREAVASLNHWEEDAEKAPGSRFTRLCVHNLLCRMEARPLSVLIWGDSSLSGRTYVTCMGLVATYLVVLLQLRQPLDDPDDEFHCFQAMK